MTFTPLILAGGRSTRMKSPKHLLKMPDGRPLYQHQIDLLARACPDAPAIYISLAQDSELDDYLQSLPTAATTTTTTTITNQPSTSPDPAPKTQPLTIIRDLTPNKSPVRSAGPAAGLLAAFRHHPEATWLVVACDHPFLTPAALQHLCRAYQPPVTCFQNEDGFCEPLVAVWSPAALQALAERAGAPSRVVRSLGGKEVPVGDCRDCGVGRGVLRGINTKEEWEEAVGVLSEMASGWC